MTKLKGKFGESEIIDIEVGMFDGCIFVPTSGDESTNRHMHLSLLIHVKKGESLNQLIIICSAWPDCLEIQKIAVLPRDQSKSTLYMGPYLKYESYYILCLLFFSALKYHMITLTTYYGKWKFILVLIINRHLTVSLVHKISRVMRKTVFTNYSVLLYRTSCLL